MAAVAAGACSRILPPARARRGWRLAAVGAAGSLSLACLSALCGLLTWTVLPAALGWRSDVVLTGSMTPAIAPGDVVVSGPVPPQGGAVGQVLLVQPPGSANTVVHRVSRRLDDGRMVLRGDANLSEDVVALTVSDIHGLPRLRVPYVGLPALWLRERRFVPLLVTLAALGAACAATVGGFGPARRADPPPSRWRPQPAAGGALAGCAVALAVGVGVHAAAPAGVTAAAFSATTADAGNVFAAQTFPRYYDQVRSDAPTFYHRLDEPAGTTVAADSRAGAPLSPGTYDGTTTRPPSITAATSATPADGGQAVQFSSALTASGDGVPSLGVAVTLEAWVRTTARDASILGLSTAPGSGQNFPSPRLFVSNDGFPCLGVSRGTDPTTAYKCGNTRADNDTWHHLVGTVSLANAGTAAAAPVLTLYLDGTVVTSFSRQRDVTWAGATSLQPTTASPRWRLGTDRHEGWPFIFSQAGQFSGGMDEVAVYPAVLSAARVSAHWAARTGAGYAATIIADTPSRYWRLDDLYPTLANALSPGGETGTYTGLPYTPGPFQTGVTGAVSSSASPSTALRLNGTRGVYSPAGAAPQPFSVELWFRTTSANGAVLVNFANTATGASAVKDRAVYLSPAGRLHGVVAPGGTQRTVSSVTGGYNDGSWHHVALTVGAAGLRLVVDAVLVAADPAVTTARTATGVWRVGGDAPVAGWSEPPTGSGYLVGDVDEVAVYPVQLSDEEVAVHVGARLR